MENAILKELDSVILITDLEKVPKGTTGTIVFDYSDFGLDIDMFEVEFFDDNNDTICVATACKEDLKKIEHEIESTVNLNLLEYSWSAVVVIYEDKTIPIWWTAWPSIKSIVTEVLSVSSDLPKYQILDPLFIIK